VEHSGYPATSMSSQSVTARLSTDAAVTSHRRGNGDRTSSGGAGSSVTAHSVVTHVDASGSNPLSSLAGADIPLGRVPPPPLATSGECLFTIIIITIIKLCLIYTE